MSKYYNLVTREQTNGGIKRRKRLNYAENEKCGRFMNVRISKKLST